MNFAEIQDELGTEERDLNGYWAFEAITWLLSRLIKERARAMEAEHKEQAAREFNPVLGYYHSIDCEVCRYVPDDWERKAEKELREER